MSFWQMHRNIQVRILSSTLMRMTGTMIFPFMGIYFSVKLGQELAGIILILNAAVTMVTGFYGGYITDRIGRKKVLVAATAIQLGAFVVMTFANSPWLDSAWLTFAMMLVQSFCGGLVNPAAEAMLIDVSTKENRKLMYAIQYWTINLAIMIGALLGGLLFQEYRFELFVALTLVTVFTLLLTVFFMSESLVVQQDAKPKQQSAAGVLREIVGTYRTVMRDRAFMLFWLASLLVIALEFQNTNYIAVRLAHEFQTQTVSLFDWTLRVDGFRAFSMTQIENTVLIVLGSAVMAKVMKRVAEGWALYGGIFLYTLGFGVVGVTNTLWLLALAVLAITLGEMLYVPVKQAQLAELVPDGMRGSYMVVNGLMFQLAKMLGAIGITVGALVPSSVMSTAYLVLGCAGLLCFRLVFRGESSVKKRVAA